jgi:hypothetical protein
MVEETVSAVTMQDKAADALTFDPIEALGAYDNLLSQGAEGVGASPTTIEKLACQSCECVR